MTAAEARTGAPHTIEQLYDQALECMQSTVHALAARVPPPKAVLYRGQPAFRYAEKALRQAIVQKLVRYVSGLQAARVLLESGGRRLRRPPSDATVGQRIADDS